MASPFTVPRKTFWSIVAASVALVSPGLIAQYNPPYTDTKLRPERTIIVTGATGVLGYPTVRNLARRHCRIIMACRDLEKCKALRREVVLHSKNQSIICRHLDLEDIDSINDFANEMIETEPHIDVLINNAAVKETKGKELTKYGIEKHYFVNFLAPYLLTLKLMPKLEESALISRDSRVLNVIGSPKKWWHIELLDINFDERKWTNKAAYSQSKLALAYFSILLEKFNKQKGNNVYVYGISPSAKRILPLDPLKTGIFDKLKYDLKDVIMTNANRVCYRIVYVALDQELGVRRCSGKLYDFLRGAFKRNNGWGIAAMNEEKAELVWNVAADLLLSAEKGEEPKSSSPIETEPEDKKGAGSDKKS